MCDNYAEALLRIALAQVCENKEFSHVRRTCLDSLVSITRLFIQQIGSCASRFATHAGRTSPNALDVRLAIEMEMPHFQIQMYDLIEYANYLREMPNECPDFPISFPPFPVKREVQGSERELITPSSSASSISPSSSSSTTSSSHVPEHIPPWLPSFPHPRTYKNTPVFDLPAPDKEEKARASRSKSAKEVEQGDLRHFNLLWL